MKVPYVIVIGVIEKVRNHTMTRDWYYPSGELNSGIILQVN